MSTHSGSLLNRVRWIAWRRTPRILAKLGMCFTQVATTSCGLAVFSLPGVLATIAS
jgi:hypothetical protein